MLTAGHGWLTSIVILLPAVIVFNLMHYRIERTTPEIEMDGYFGPDDIGADDVAIHKYTIDIPTKRIDDLKERLKLSRYPDTLEDSSMGIPIAFVKSLQEHMETFDWKQHQYFMNTFKHYRTEIEGVQIHFVRITTPPAEGKELIPLVLLHGFPGSWWDFFKVAPILSNPARYGFDFGVKKTILFDVIIPSLPGFLFSEKPRKAGLGTAESARILNAIMSRLSISKYFVHGGEGVGADIAAALGTLYPQSVLGLHLSNPFIPPFCDVQFTFHYLASGMGFMNDEDRRTTTLTEYSTGAQFMPVTRSDVVASSLTDSPMGLAAFILDKWMVGSNGNSTREEQTLEKMFTIDELLTEVNLYWLTDTIPHALRLLENSFTWEHRCKLITSTVIVPTAIVQTPNAPWRTGRHILNHKFHNITRYSILPKGGLFHSLQDAQNLAADIFSFVEIETSV